MKLLLEKDTHKLKEPKMMEKYKIQKLKLLNDNQIVINQIQLKQMTIAVLVTTSSDTLQSK